MLPAMRYALRTCPPTSDAHYILSASHKFAVINQWDAPRPGLMYPSESRLVADTLIGKISDFFFSFSI